VSQVPRLRPYSGHRLERIRNLGRAWTQTDQDTDAAGLCSYEFNSLGFRGPEFDAQAEFTVFVFGESDAFGIGVEREESWAYLVAMEQARLRGVDPEAVCLMNFAEGGASNAAIARSVLTQCSAVRPDLVLVNFAQHGRTEGYAQGHMFPIGPWHGAVTPDQAIKEAPPEDGLRERIGDQVERGQAFLRFCDLDQGVYDSLRDILLVQETLAQEGLDALAIIRDPEHFNRAEIVGDPALGPLISRLDRCFFAVHVSPLKLLDEVDWLDDGFHYGAGTHRAVADQVLVHLQVMAEKKEDTPPPTMDAAGAEIGAKVREFYSQVPEDFPGTLKDQVRSIRGPGMQQVYPDLHAYLRERRHHNLLALDVGCGGGWLAHGLALHHSLRVDAVDFAPQTLEQARALGPLLGTAPLVRVREGDLFDLRPPPLYDLITCLGVLHHTANPLRALERLVRMLAPGGHIYLGLYHAPGRSVFLEELRRTVEAGGEEEAFRRYRDLRFIHSKDERLARFWFHDQVLHPHETQHTLKEVCGWFDALGLTLASTSIGFFPWVEERESLFDLESLYERRARKALFEEKRYFPGFFTAFGRRAH
jgi:SAM-dependent methyltransferase